MNCSTLRSTRYSSTCLKNSSKSGLFDQKMGFYSRKTPKAGLLKSIFKGWGYIQEWDCTRADTVLILLLHCKFSFSRSIVEKFVYHLCGTMSRLSKVELLSKVVTQCASFLYLSNSSLADPHIHRKPSALTSKWQISNRCIHAKRFDENGSFSGTSHDDDDDNV